MSATLISIALCTYNGEKYIEEQLQSILNQTYQNLEIIIVDDCSIDKTITIVETYATKDSRIKFYKNTYNLGFNKNFERAIGLTTGAFIAISDQDDIWKPFKLEVLFNNIKDNWLIFSNSSSIDQNGINTNKELLKSFSLSNRTYKSLLLNNWLTGHTVLFKQELLNYIMPFPENIFYDWWIGFVAIYHHKITYIKDILTLHRIHQDSVIQTELQLNRKIYKKQQLKLTISMLTAFINYKLVSNADKKFIAVLRKALGLKDSNSISIPLIRLLYLHYNDLFPERKKRSGLSKLNFAYKIVKTS
ncbi:MAG: glycosyltransferase [Rickettsiales bacterium]|nr:MAG: glycosyltransferase [Rickettsiales bacterium]